jgi:hypothetical protein
MTGPAPGHHPRRCLPAPRGESRAQYPAYGLFEPVHPRLVAAQRRSPRRAIQLPPGRYHRRHQMQGRPDDGRTPRSLPRSAPYPISRSSIPPSGTDSLIISPGTTAVIDDQVEVLLVTGIANPAPLKRWLGERSQTYYELAYSDHHISSHRRSQSDHPPVQHSRPPQAHPDDRKGRGAADQIPAGARRMAFLCPAHYPSFFIR